MTRSSVTIQITPESKPTTPLWMGEVAAFAQVLTHTGSLKTIQEQVRFTRARFGRYEVIDFVAVLISYILSGEATLLAFYKRLAPFAEPFMALFGRTQLPHRSTLSRFLAALDQTCVEALRTHFQRDLFARKPFSSPGGLFDRRGAEFLVTDVDGTRQAARQRALPQTDALPAPHRRFDQACAPGYQGRKRGEVVRTRTVVLQAQTHQLLGTFGGPGNGDYRGELRQAIAVITNYATQLGLSPASILVRLDGLYGDAAPLLDILSASLGLITRSRAYHLLDLEVVKQLLARPPDDIRTHPESGMTRSLCDCASVPLTPGGPEVRLVVATHAGTSSSPAVGIERDGVVYELFVSTLPSPAFAPSDVLDLYLHRGSFETVLADEDVEQDSDRWYSHTPCGQEFCQILAQWVWNLRLELGQKLSSFTLQPDGALRCPADHPLYPQERRPERDGSIRVLYAARIGHCRCCQLRARCQESSSSLKPRRVSAVLWPLSDTLSACLSPPPEPPELPPLSPVLWRDWPRCQLRRQWLKLIRSETMTFFWEPPQTVDPTTQTREEVVTRAKRAHYRLSWQERLARNARQTSVPTLTVTLHGLPPAFAISFGFALQTAA